MIKITEEIKICKDCDCELVVNDNWYESNKKARKYVCNDCSSKQRKQHYLENKEQILEQHRQYYLENKETIRQYRLENREQRLEYSKQYYLENKKIFKQYRLENKEKMLEYDKERYNKFSLLSEKYLLPKYLFKCNCLEYGFVAKLADTSNAKRNNIKPLKIKPKELWYYYCSHVYLNNRICMYTQKPLQYFYSDNSAKVLNEYMPSLDHILPISTIGENEISNVAFVTWNMNLRKSNLTLQEYFDKLISDNNLSETAKPDVNLILEQINNTYQFYRKNRGTSKMLEVEDYVNSTSPYKFIEEELLGLDVDLGL